MRKIVEIRHNNNGRGYTGRDVSLMCAFDRSYFVFYLNLSYIHANQPFSIVHPEQKVNTTVLAILRLPHILTLITFLTNVFTTIIISWYFVFFVISRCACPAANFRILESFEIKRLLLYLSMYIINTIPHEKCSLFLYQKSHSIAAPTFSNSDTSTTLA